jgi:hypothetical protein
VHVCDVYVCVCVCVCVCVLVDFVMAVQAAPGVDSEGIEVAAQCLSEVFKLNQ